MDRQTFAAAAAGFGSRWILIGVGLAIAGATARGSAVATARGQQPARR